MGLFNFFKKNKAEEKQPEPVSPAQPGNTVDEAQQSIINDSSATAELLVSSFNSKYGGAFDYSERSLVALDDLLDNFADFKDQLDPGMLEDLIAQAGSYIFEVARRNYGGRYFWLEERNQPIFVTGIPDFEIALVAFDKVRMRIENGKEDSIPFFFKGYSERVVQAKPGDRAMIV